MSRHLLVAGAVALSVMLPAVAQSAPTGGAVYRAAPVFVRPAFPQRPMAEKSVFNVPFHIGTPPKASPETFHLPAPQWYTWRGWTSRPHVLLVSSPCLMNAPGWPPYGAQQNWSGESATPAFTIGSLAGDPAHSVLRQSASDLAASLASSKFDDTAPPGGISFQLASQPFACGPSGFAGF